MWEGSLFLDRKEFLNTARTAAATRGRNTCVNVPVDLSNLLIHGHFRRISCIIIMCQQETRTADRITDETDYHPTE